MQQAHVGELREVGAGGLADDVVLQAVGADVRARLGVFQEVEDEGALTVVEGGGVPELLLELLLLAPLAFEVFVEVGDGFLDGAELVADEIVEVVVVLLRVEEGAVVTLGMSKNFARDGDVFKNPKALLQHSPIEQSARGAPVAVHKGVVVGQPEVQDDGTHHGVQEKRVVPLVGEIAEQLQARG